MLFRNLFGITIIFLLSVSCSRKAAPLLSSMHTEGLHHKWHVLKMAGVENLQAGAFIDLRDIYHSGGSLGCRYFYFTPKYGHNNKMQIQNIATRFAPCDDDVPDAIFLNNLKSVASFSFTTNNLKLNDAHGTEIFNAELATGDERGSLNRKWFIEKMINADNDLLIKDSAYINFTDMDNAAGNVGCNSFAFKVTADDTYHISIKAGISTKMFCKEANKNEVIFSKVLPLINMYQVIGNRIRLFDKDNALLIEAVAALQ